MTGMQELSPEGLRAEPAIDTTISYIDLRGVQSRGTREEHWVPFRVFPESKVLRTMDRVNAAVRVGIQLCTAQGRGDAAANS